MKTFTLALCLLVLTGQSAAASDFRFSPRPNKAQQIQWRSWGQAAFDEAKKKDRLVLLSLSAVWCHWCHVMDETTYSDPEVIRYLNENYIPVRVDVDMRPDIDALYNQGGWPSTAILTADGEIVSGGNYFPPQEMLARLKRAVTFMANNGAAVKERIAELKAMKELKASQQEESTELPGKSTISDILEIVRDSFDEKYGGFGSGQKFPSPDTIDFLLSEYERRKDPALLNIVTTTLDHMAAGALRDHVEGGFFRYATKPDWSEPHYEKMLDLNAGMIRNYAEAAIATGRKDYARIAQETVEYVRNDLYDAGTGAFFGSQDADEIYYTKQDRKALPRPAVDMTSYADSSSLMVSAFVAAYGATGDERYLTMAVKAADFLMAHLDSGTDGVFHYVRAGKPGLTGLLMDNALFGNALLDCYGATGEARYLDRARTIGRLIRERFYDKEKKRFRPYLDGTLRKPVTAGVMSGMNDDLANYRALIFLSRFASVEGDASGTKLRDAIMATLAAGYRDHAPAAAAYGNALLWSVEDPVEIVIIAGGNGPRKYLEKISTVAVPQKVVRVLSLAKDNGEIKRRGYALRESVYLCAGKRCSKPITSPEELQKELMDFVAMPPGTEEGSS